MAITRHRSHAHHVTLGVCLAAGALTASCGGSGETVSGGTGAGGSGDTSASSSGGKTTSTGAGQGSGGSSGATTSGAGAGQGGASSTTTAGGTTMSSGTMTSGGTTMSSGTMTSGGGGQGGGPPSCVPADCDDGDLCTTDACVQGMCTHGKVDPDDKNACTIDSCDPKLGVVHTTKSCDDNNPCTADSCNPSSGCVTTPITYFVETFADNSKGWQLGGIGTGTPWEIGPLKPNPTPPAFGSADPTQDHTPTADNGVAGVSIGNNTGSAPHSPYYLVSPTIDASTIEGPVFLEFWRYLNSDAPPFMNSTVEVFDGAGWVSIFGMSLGMTINDSDWVRQSFDVTAYKNKDFQVRWGWEVKMSGALSESGWNVDDVRLIPANSCP